MTRFTALRSAIRAQLGHLRGEFAVMRVRVTCGACAISKVIRSGLCGTGGSDMAFSTGDRQVGTYERKSGLLMQRQGES